MRSSIHALVLAAAIVGVTAVAGTAAPEEPPAYRLVLVDGTTRDVRGPVERRDGLVLFRNSRGWLVSLRDSQVTEIRPLDGSDTALPAGRPPTDRDSSRRDPEPRDEGPAIRFTNADLPPGPAGAPPEPAVEPGDERSVPDRIAGGAVDVPGVESIADTDSRTEPLPGEPAQPELIETPSEVGGHSEAWWREEIGRLRDEIDELERQENLTYRLWICAMNGVPLEGGECRPRVNQLPPVNAVPRTRLQKSLTEQLREYRAEKENRRSELKRFIDDAIAAGVPTAWLLTGS